MKIKTLEKINEITMKIWFSVVTIFTMLGLMGLPLPVYVSVVAVVKVMDAIVESVTWKKIKEYYNQENK